MGNGAGYFLTHKLREGIVEIVFKGNLCLGDMPVVLVKILDVVKNSHARGILVDVRKLKERLGPVEAYHRVRRYPVEMIVLPTAVVDLPEHSAYENFHQTTNRNTGITFQWFTALEVARTWLKETLQERETAGERLGMPGG